jgi:hypothetical protein
VNPVEARVLALSRNWLQDNEKRKSIDTYTIKVGDICLVAIGQIVGRGYQAVRYQPTANIVINSPTEDTRLREHVQAIWASKDAAKCLFDSLLLDYSTEGIYKEGEGFDEWDVGSDLQVKAAMRLLYYFPNEATPLIARRLQGLHIERTGPGCGSLNTPKEMEAWERRELTNGVRTEKFVKAVSWCKDSAIRAAVHSIFKRTGDVDILLAALPGIDAAEPDLIRMRLGSFLERVPADERGAYGEGYNLLVAAGKRLGVDGKPLFLRYATNAGPMRRYTLCQVLKVTNKDWSIELLKTFLEDKRAVGGYGHAASKADRENRLDIRVCDAAAETLGHNHPELKFEMTGSDRELDQQIQVIREHLARRKR